MASANTSTLKAWVYDSWAYLHGSEIGGPVDLDDYESFEEFERKVSSVIGEDASVYIHEVDSDFRINVPDIVSLQELWDLHVFITEELYDEGYREAFADYLNNHGWDQLDWAMSSFSEAYMGQWKSLEDFAWDYAEEALGVELTRLYGFRIEVDLVAWECDYWISDNGHVFRNL